MKITYISDEIATLQIMTEEEPYLLTNSARHLKEAIDGFNQNPTLRAVLLEGGKRNFCAGANYQLLVDSTSRRAFLESVYAIPGIIMSLKVPSIAVMQGHALGGGLAVGLWCDLPYLSMESLYGANFITLGFTPGMGATQIVLDAFGEFLGRELLYTGRLIKGREIQKSKVSLSHAIFPKEALRACALQRASEIAQMPALVLNAYKQNLVKRRLSLLELVLQQEREMHDRMFANQGAQVHIHNALAPP